MALSLSAVKAAKSAPLPIGIFYGPPKVGKTTLASEFPNPVYVNTPGEAAPAGLEVQQPLDEDGKPATIETFDELLDFIGELIEAEHDFQTLIIDSVDGLEPMVWKAACAANEWGSIEEPGYGKGYVEADEYWREFLSAIEALAAKGVWVVLIAHTEITRFDSPTSEPYSRYGIKLHKRASALIQEASSLIGFMNYRVSIKEIKEGFGKKSHRGEGAGERQIHLEERPGFIAGNRFGMPPVIPFKEGKGWESMSKWLDNGSA